MHISVITVCFNSAATIAGALESVGKQTCRDVEHIVVDGASSDGTADVEFRFYQKVEGRFRIPEGALLKSVDVRVLAQPGGQVKLSRTINLIQ